MKKTKKFIDDLLNERLDFDAYTVRNLDFTLDEALEIYDLIRIEIKSEKNPKIWAHPQLVMFLLNMNYFGVTPEIFKSHLEKKYNYGK